MNYANNIEFTNETAKTVSFRSIVSLIPSKTNFSSSARADLKDLSQFKNAINNGTIKINAKDELDWTFLHYAAARNNAEAIEFLIKKGAKTEITNSDGETPLFIATILENIDAIKSLIKMGANVDIRNPSGDHLLYIVDHMKNNEVKDALQLELRKKTIDIYSNPKAHLRFLKNNNLR